MHPFYSQSGVDHIDIVISRHESEACDIAPALNTLETLLYDAETVRMFQGQVGLSFHGYDADTRELYEIPEVRDYLAALDSKFPYWFYFLSTYEDTLKMIAFCLCRTHKIDAGLAYPDRADMQTFIFAHFDAINPLFDRFALDESINEKISGLIADYFFPRPA